MMVPQSKAGVCVWVIDSLSAQPQAPYTGLIGAQHPQHPFTPPPTPELGPM